MELSQNSNQESILTNKWEYRKNSNQESNLTKQRDIA